MDPAADDRASHDTITMLVLGSGEGGKFLACHTAKAI
jgi:hypothetical protein